MMDFTLYGSAAALLIWLIILLLPWQTWRVKEVLEAAETTTVQECDLSDLTVLIPVRNEAELIAATLAGLEALGAGVAGDSR